MAFYDKFPYTNFQEINLDRIIKELMEVKNGLDFVIENASLKYADPIQWNITHQYAANTVVIDPETGIAYISTQPVPDNILITNTDYWTPIFDLSTFFDDTETQIAALQTAVNSLNTTTETHSTEIQDLQDDTAAQAQDITNLQTDVTNLNTVINNISDIVPGNPVNVLTLGVKNDASEDASTIVNEATKTMDLYFPAGEYLFDNPLTPEHSIIGAGHTRIEPGITIFKMHFVNNNKGVIDFTDSETTDPILVKDISIDCEYGAGYGIHYNPDHRILVELRNITISNNKNWAIISDIPYSTSRPLYAQNISIKADGNNGGKGIYLSAGSGDSYLSDLEIMYVETAIENYSYMLRLNNAHLYGGRYVSDVTEINTHWPNTIGVNNYGSIYAENIYLDSFFQGWVQRSSTASIGNLIIWYDTWMTGASRTDGTGIRAAGYANLTVSHLTYSYCNYVSTLYGPTVSVKSLTYRNVPAMENIISHGVPWMQSGMNERACPKIADNSTYIVMVAAVYASRGNSGRSRGMICAGNNDIVQIYIATGTPNKLTVRVERYNGSRNFYWKKISDGVVGIYADNLSNAYPITQDCHYSTETCAILDTTGMIDTETPHQTNATGLTQFTINTETDITIY